MLIGFNYLVKFNSFTMVIFLFFITRCFDRERKRSALIYRTGRRRLWYLNHNDCGVLDRLASHHCILLNCCVKRDSCCNDQCKYLTCQIEMNILMKKSDRDFVNKRILLSCYTNRSEFVYMYVEHPG